MKLLKLLLPPPGWRTVAVIITGAIVGLGIYTFIVSNAVSYVSDKPETCINCHIMNVQYASWFHSAHRGYASCNDCHVPHTNPVSKYFFKAQDGMRHASIFTLRAEPQVILIKEAGKAVVQENCKRCHSKMNENVGTLAVSLHTAAENQGKLCWDCHREVPHGRVSSLSTSTYARVPRLGSPVPAWLQKMMNSEKKEN